jgi:hypothetical protein
MIKKIIKNYNDYIVPIVTGTIFTKNNIQNQLVVLLIFA